MKIFLISFALIIIYAGCSERNVKPIIDRTLNADELPAQESWNATIFFTDSGSTKAVLATGHLRMFEKLQMTLLDSGVHVDFYGIEENITTVLTSLRGKVNDATKDLYALDSVVAISDSGVTLKTEELMWRNKDKKIVSDKFVTIITPVEKIQGYGFESDQALRNYVIYNITYTARNDSL